MKRNNGFTLLEMMIATMIFAAGSIYVYATFTGVTRASRTATIEIDLGSQNKGAMTRIFNELQATSLTPQDTDGLDSTEPETVCIVADDVSAPVPETRNIVLERPPEQLVSTEADGVKGFGITRQQARERTIATSRSIRFRKVIGYQFNAGAGSITPEWSKWITFRINDKHQLIRVVDGGSPRIIANMIDALDASIRPDGTMLVTLISARRDPTGNGWRRYANAVTIHPKN